MSTTRNATPAADVGSVIETVCWYEHCSEPRRTLLLAWVQGCTATTTVLVPSWLRGSGTWRLCTSALIHRRHIPGALLASGLAAADLHISTHLFVMCQRMDKKERFAGLCFVLLPMLFWRFYRQFGLNLQWTVVKDISMTHWPYVDTWPSYIVMQWLLISTLAVLPCFTIWLVRDF